MSSSEPGSEASFRSTQLSNPNSEPGSSGSGKALELDRRGGGRVWELGGGRLRINSYWSGYGVGVVDRSRGEEKKVLEGNSED